VKIVPQEIRDRMERLELSPDRDRDVGTAAREICRVPDSESEAFSATLRNEVWRTTVLCRTHYAKSVAVLPDERIMMAAMLQGITLAAAVLEQYLDDAHDQAAYWRQRAIALGADPEDYERSR
jgi:hypothetical protein